MAMARVSMGKISLTVGQAEPAPAEAKHSTTHRHAVIVVAFSTPAPNSHAVPKSGSPDRTYVPAIGRRPAVSKRRPSNSGPRKLPKARSGR
jgi:hypothetical protein